MEKRNFDNKQRSTHFKTNLRKVNNNDLGHLEERSRNYQRNSETVTIFQMNNLAPKITKDRIQDSFKSTTRNQLKPRLTINNQQIRASSEMYTDHNKQTI